MQKSQSDSFQVKATLLVTSTLTVMAGATIAPSLPAMETHFAGVDRIEFWVRFVLTIPALFIVIGAPIAGWIVDRFGRKPLLFWSVIAYGFAGSSGFILSTLEQILLGRALLGLAVGGIMTSVTTLIADYYVGAARIQYLGLQAAFMNLGGVIFLSVGGFLSDVNWRMPFLIYLIAFCLLPFIVTVLYEPTQVKAGMNSVSVANQSPSQSSTALLILIYGSALISQIVFYLIPVQLPFYLKSLANVTAFQSGLAIAFTTLFSGIAAIAYGRVKARLNFAAILSFTFGLFGIGYTIVSFVNNYEQVLIGLAIAGLGLGLLMPNLTVWLSASVPDAIRERALGGLTTFMFLGQFLSPIISQPLSQQLTLRSTYSLAGYLMIFLAIVLAGMKRQVTALHSHVHKSH
jgi:MFS family permease